MKFTIQLSYPINTAESNKMSRDGTEHSQESGSTAGFVPPELRAQRKRRKPFGFPSLGD
jgi:hypothetical protein